jgi:hypothetical protein
VLELHVGGDRKKDAEYNVQRYARLGVREYFIYDREKEKLEGYRLPWPGAGRYEPMELSRGRYVSEVLGLELQVEEARLCFWVRKEVLLDSEEWGAIQEKRAQQAERRWEEEARRRQEAARRADEQARLRQEEARRREQAEREAAELRAELERLRGQLR